MFPSMNYRSILVSSFATAFVTCLTAVLPLQASAASGEKQYAALRPGLWEIRTATRMQGMPYELPPVPYTTNQCLTQELLNNQENLAKVTATRGECEIHDTEVSDARTTWSMTCYQNGMEIDANGSITPITQEIYTGNVHFTMHNANIKAINGVVNVQGAWQGECASGQNLNQAKPTYRTPVYPAR